ncbi:MAG: carboxymuconolactone decarboxylase family protein [Oligoflexales bacterium]
MTIQTLRDNLGDYAKDIRINLSSVLSEEGAPGLKREQIVGIALASAYWTRDPRIIDAISTEAALTLVPKAIEAAKGAATIMAMNNVYYRSMHLNDDPELSKLPAKLRMSIIGNPGVEKVDFELYCLGVSALAGCGACISAHAKEVKKANISNEGVQSAIRIAAVINATSQALVIG